MLRLLLADLRRHAGTWAWTCVITLVAGACVSGQLRILHGALDSAAKATGVTPQGVPRSTDMLHAARLMSGFIIALIVLAAAAVLVSTAGLALTQRRRDHGLWRALGMRPGGLRALLLGQLVVVAALGSLVGSLAGGPVSALMMPLLIEQDVAMPGTVARWAVGGCSAGAERHCGDLRHKGRGWRTIGEPHHLYAEVYGSERELYDRLRHIYEAGQRRHHEEGCHGDGQEPRIEGL